MKTRTERKAAQCRLENGYGRAVRRVFLIICLIAGISIWGISPMKVSAEQTGFSAKVAALKAKYPDGKYWNHVGMVADNSDGYTDKPCELHRTDGVDHVYGTGGCTCNHFAGGGHLSATQCMGFANKLAYDVFGNTTWQTVSNPSAAQIADIRAGDIVRLAEGHSVFVISRTGDSITVGEANYPNGCQIKWDRVIVLSAATVSYYERAANYVSVMGDASGTLTPEQTSTEQVTTEKTTESETPFTGWKKAGDGTHYQYFEKSVLQKEKWLKIGKKKYYVDKSGYRVTGLFEIDDKLYYFNSKGVLQKKKWVSAGGNYYYADSSGRILKSQWLYKSNILVYVKADGAIAKSGIVKIQGKQYYFDKNGKRSKGFKKVGKKYYYCNSSGVIQKKKWITVKKKTYYLQKNGVRAANKLLKIGRYRYYFDSKGRLVKDKEIIYKNKIYEADKKGHCKQTGIVEDDGQLEE